MMRRLLFVLLFLATAAHAQNDPGLRAFGFAPAFVDAGLPFTLLVSYANIGESTATGVTITIDAPAASGFPIVPPICTASGTRVTCTIDTLEPRPPLGSFAQFAITIKAPSQSDATVPLHVEISAANRTGVDANDAASHVYRTFYVENTNDSGAGSLRDAIVAANDACRAEPPCKIAFRIQANGAAVHTIRPLTELATITAHDLWIDGTTQARYVADSSSAGPEIELNGALQASGDGIRIGEQCGFHLLGLVVNGFPNNAISVTGSQACESAGTPHERVIATNYLGTDATGTIAVPNNRGITLDTATSPIVIEENVISGNLRSGIFILGGSGTVVRRNTIGLALSRQLGLGNGASGVYIAPGGANTDVNDNYIGFNAHFGVAIARGAIRVALHGNSFQANQQLAVDYGLDGVTPVIPEAHEGAPLPGVVVGMPSITVARYDPATNTTIIKGVAPTADSRQAVMVALYANDAPDPSGFGEGQYYLGDAEADPLGTFSFTYDGQVPGPWIAATATRRTIIGFSRGPRVNGISGAGYVTTTSEFSRTIQVR